MMLLIFSVRMINKFFLLYCVCVLCCLNITLVMADEISPLHAETVSASGMPALIWYPVVPLPSVNETSDIKQEDGQDVTAEIDRQLDDEVELSQPWHALIVKVANKYQVDHHLIKAFIYHESRFKMHAVSKKGAIGLMQVMPNTARRFGFSDLHNPENNLRAGTAYLKWLLTFFGNNVTLAAAAYNAGEGAVKRYGGVPPYQETQRYVDNILRYYQKDTHSFSNNETRIVSPSAPINTFFGAARVLGHVASLWFMSSKK